MGQRKQLISWMTVGVFALAILWPLLGLRSQERSRMENRALAPRPERRGSLAEWKDDFEAYFNDQYGGREALLLGEETLWRKLGIYRAPLVIEGKDGWLFYGNLGEDSPLRDFMGESRLGEEALRRWSERLQARRDRLAALGIVYGFAVAPNKMEIFSEYLPGRYLRRIDASRLEQLETLFGDRSGDYFISFRDAMSEAAQGNGPLPYGKGGTHWNAYGAATGQNVLIRWLAGQIEDLEARRFSRSDFALGEAIEDTDLARLARLESRYPASGPRLSIPIETGEWETLQVAEPVLEELGEWKLGRFPGGEGRVAVVFGDSFFDGLAPYLGLYFERVYFVSAIPSDVAVEAAARAWKPDLLLELRVERFLCHEPVEGRAKLD